MNMHDLHGGVRGRAQGRRHAGESTIHNSAALGLRFSNGASSLLVPETERGMPKSALGPAMIE